MAGDWILAIDFGTTSTAAAIRVGDSVERIEIDGLPRMPSLVYWREGTGAARTGRLVLGQEADELSGLAPWCLERTPKRRIGDEFMRLGEKELRVVDVVGAILRKVAEEAISLRGGELPGELRLTHPARWGHLRLEKLRQAAEVAGFGSPVFVPEPVAAATHFASERLSAGQHVAVYDLGGGTFDTAVLRRTEDSFELVGAPGGDENLGGEDFDDRLYRYLGRQLARDKWQALRESTDRPWTQANRELLRNAHKTKEFLSRSAQYEFYMPPPIDQELLASAEGFRELIIGDVEATVAELEHTIRGAGVEPTQLAAIYLAGGSSRIPIISRIIQQRLGQLPESLDDPKVVTALGAARLPSVSTAGPKPTLEQTSDTQPTETELARPTPVTALTELAHRHEGQPETLGMDKSGAGTLPARPRLARTGIPPAPPPEYPRESPKPGGHPVVLILLTLVALAGIGAGALAAGGVFSSSTPTQTITTITGQTSTGQTSSGQPSTVQTTAIPAGTTSCGGGVYVGRNTSCGFAMNVQRAYDQSGGGNVTVTAFSPATGLSYTIACTGGSPHVCTGGSTKGASVYFS